MGLMTENKAERLLKDYMAAELKGDDQTAEDIETQLNNAGWKISVGADGYTVIRENGGLFTDNGAESGETPYTETRFLPPNTTGTQTGGSNLPLIIGISVGSLILITAIILGIRAYKQSRNAVAG